MNTLVVMRSACFAVALVFTGAAIAAELDGPKIDTMAWEEAETVCEAWPIGIAANEARLNGLIFVSYPAAVKPFGMRGYMAIDGKTHPLRQVAYALNEGTLSIYYRTLGDYHYDVYFTLTAQGVKSLKGADLTGTLVASRFGRHSQIEIAGICEITTN